MIKTPLSTVIGGAFWTPGATILGSSSKNLTQIIKSIFATGEQGFAYDPNDLTTLYQDAAGTIPVTAAGQPVGLMLDKSKGGVGTPRRNLLAYSEVFTNAVWLLTTVTFSKDALGYKATNLANGGYIHQGSSISIAAVRTATFILGAASARYVHLKVAALALGINQAGVVVDMVNKTITATTTGGAGYTVLSSLLQVLENGNIKVVLTTQGYGQAQRVVINSATTSDGSVVGNTGDSFYLISAQFEEGDKATAYQKIDSDYGSWTAGNHAYQTVSASRPILQRNATTGAYYLAFDGADDFLQTNNIDFTATDKVSLFAGGRKLSDATAGCLVEISANSATVVGTFGVLAPLSSGDLNFRSGGSLPASGTTVTPQLQNIDFVITANADIGSRTATLKVDGKVRANSTTNQGTGNYGNYPLYIGRRAGTSLPFNGHLYSLIGIGRLTTDSETITLEKAIAKNTGVTLNV